MVALAFNIHGDGTSRSALQCGNAHTASNHSIVASIRRIRYIFFGSQATRHIGRFMLENCIAAAT